MRTNPIACRVMASLAALILAFPFLITFLRIWQLGSEQPTEQHEAKSVEVEQKVKAANEQIWAAGQPGIVVQGETILETWLDVWPKLGGCGTFGRHPRLALAGFILILAVVLIALICIWMPERTMVQSG